jgi:hypothetical protein
LAAVGCGKLHNWLLPSVHVYVYGGDLVCCLAAVLLLLLLQAVLQFKWETFAGRMVTAEFCCFLAWLVAFSVFMLLFQVNTGCPCLVLVTDAYLTESKLGFQ